MAARLHVPCAVLVFCATCLLAGSFAIGAEPSPGPRMVAEWEPALGTLIRWPLGLPFDVVRELARDDTLYTLVSGPGAESQARATFAAENIELDHVVFIHTPIYSMWTRDWGPQAVFAADGVMGYADPWFNGYPWVPGCFLAAAVDPTPLPLRSGRGYHIDDAIPAAVAAFLGVPHHPLQAYLTGGNIMTDGLGIAWSTEQMVAENAGHMNIDTFLARVETVTGIDDYRFVISPEIHGIQHIDCYAKLLDEETVLVKEVPGWHPEHACCEAVASAFASTLTCYGRPYEVVRIWCPPYSGNHVAAYTNSLILNRKVLVPLFGLASDAAALQTYSDAMPGYEVHGFVWSAWYSYDALHCRTLGIFDPGMLRLLHARLVEPLPAGQDHRIAAWLDARSGEPPAPGAQLVHWRKQGEPAWQAVPLISAGADSFEAWIPAQAAGAEIEYYLAAADQSGRTAVLPRGAPAAFYSFTVAPATTAPPAMATLFLQARPNPFNPRTVLDVRLPAAAAVTLRIYDARGRLVADLWDGPLTAGRHHLAWDGAGADGRAQPSGVYLARLQTGREQVLHKLVLAR
jgi:agmatine deiminase